MRPGHYIEAVEWTGPDVCVAAHCVQLDEAEIDLFARTGTGIAHCPCSNAACQRIAQFAKCWMLG